MWLRNNRCKPFCENLWEDGSLTASAEDIRAKMGNMGRELKIWEKNVFGQVRKRCSEIREELQDLQKAHREAFTKDQQKRLEDELDELSKQEELMWKQRSRADWMAEGDRNTGFFHKVAEGRKKRNHIREIQRPDGTKTRKNEEMDEVFRSHFQSLFSAGPTHNPDDVLRSIDPVVSEEMNNELTRPYSHAEIVHALKQMAPLKAPGPDGTQFEPSRGLRQGDPLSPFLFLFCAEALSGLLRRAETQKLLHGARICRTAPRVSHLLFADDCIIFGRSNTNEIDVVKGIIRAYEGVSGQLVNLDKSSISFSGGVVEVKKLELSNRLEVNRSGASSTYLGIPSTIGRSKKEIFQMLIDRTRKKTKDWKRRWLSGAGKMILIQSVLQSIPTYLMSCFALPAQVCQQLNSVAARFFWGQKEDERRIHWRSWTKLCQTKGNGGLGFRDISLFNQAMLAKQAWRLILHDKSLLARSLKARYFPRNDILLASNAHNPSYAWKSILVGRDLLSEGIAWKIGNGARVRIGIDSWLPDGNGHFSPARVEAGKAQLHASELMKCDGGEWNKERIDECIQPGDSWKLQAQIPIDPNNSDRPFWPKGKFNMYSVKSGYLLAVEIKQRDEASTSRQMGELWKWVWSLEVIPKVKLFLWKCLSNCLPTATALRGRGIDVDGFCKRCGLSEETMEHSLRDCPWVRILWAISPIRLQPLEQEESIVLWFEKIRACPQREVHALFATLAWTIWYARNLLVFQNNEISHVDCLNIAHRSIWSKPICAKVPGHSAASLDSDGDNICKVNSDAALKVGVGVGLGAVVKRGNGAVLGCRLGFKSGVFSALEGEAFALLEGLILCREKGVREVIAETDCQHLYWMLARKDSDLSYLGDTLDKIHELKAQFHRLDFSWTPREGNSIADSIACFALSSLSCFSSHDVLPAGVNFSAG